jgi:prepilin-type N-terminal cleavage/methylation domain-containing protein
MRPSPVLRHGYSLVEVMVTMGVLSLVMAAVMPFFITNIKYQFVGEQKLLINNDVREVTNELVENAREANSFVIYQSFYDQTNYAGTAIKRDVTGDSVVNYNDRRANGASGDLLVLIYYRDPYYDSRFFDGVAGNAPATLGQGQVTRIIGYYVAPNRNISGEYALYAFDTDAYKGASSTWTTPWGAVFPAVLSSTVPQPTGTTTIEALLPPATLAYAQRSNHRIVLNDVNGLSNGLSFLNYQNRSILVRTKIVHGNQAKRVTNTYNFTITPRG